MDKRFILDLGLEEWEAWAADRGEARFRAKQIYQWTAKGVVETERMGNLPKSLREKMEADFICRGLTIEKEWVSQKDGTRKYVFSLHDGHLIETVLMKYKSGLSLCISTQAGCRMGCVFCASAHIPFGRNLSCGEIVGQVTRISDHVGERIHSVVVMGIGEPFDNYDAFLGFLRLVKDPLGPGLGARHITVSTCGIVPQMIEFMREDQSVNLAISLHAAQDGLRESLMPIARRYRLAELIPAMREYAQSTGRRITIEYSLFRDINDSAADAARLVSLLKGVHCHVNLILTNTFPDSPVQRSSPEKTGAFMNIVEKSGIPVTLRRELGSDIMAACGQLRRGMQSSEGS